MKITPPGRTPQPPTRASQQPPAITPRIPLTCSSIGTARRCPVPAAGPARQISPDRTVCHRDRPHRAPRPRLESRAPHHSPPRLSPALVRLAAPPPSPRPVAPLQHPAADHGSHLINGGRKEVTRCNRKPGNHVTIRDTAAPDRETATVLRASCASISRRATATPTTTRSGRCPGSRMLRLKLLPLSRITRTTRSARCSARSTCCAVSWRRRAARSCAPAAAARSSPRLARRLSSRRQRAGSGPTAASTRLAKKGV